MVALCRCLDKKCHKHHRGHGNHSRLTIHPSHHQTHATKTKAHPPLHRSNYSTLPPHLHHHGYQNRPTIHPVHPRSHHSRSMVNPSLHHHKSNIHHPPNGQAENHTKDDCNFKSAECLFNLTGKSHTCNPDSDAFDNETDAKEHYKMCPPNSHFCWAEMRCIPRDPNGRYHCSLRKIIDMLNSKKGVNG